MRYIIEEDRLDPRAKPIEYEIGGENGDCWICVSHASYKGHYPLIKRYSHGRKLHTSLIRYVFELSRNRQIADGMVILHSCDNKLCVNPEHLSEGTPKENSEDMVRKGRTNSQRGLQLPQTKLTDKEVYEIRELHKHRIFTNKKIAEYYGVTKYHICDIVNFRKRKNI